MVRGAREMKRDTRNSPSPGRPPSQQKVTAVMEAACRQFSVHGFDGASMDEVAKCAHVAKATVYARFGSKAGLFMAALDELSSRLPSAEELTRGSPADVRAHLRGIAHQMLQMALSWPAIGICRMLVLPMKSAPHLGEEFWKKTVEEYHAAMRRLLREADAAQLLDVPDPAIAASQFIALVTGDPTLRMLLTSQRFKSEKEGEAHVEAAVGLFMAGYSRV